ncbi:GNAT family N-acetyltransferase [Cellulosimicrobium sp. PMB13]|uniref:GNAT family N-acetyltransferase n=1 Tax=Cellulosimicrobium sp. PMB13 TaxID=3120158 RepID=UPI003F4B5FC6
MASVVRARDEDWRALRDVRLRALAESPSAFGSTLAREVAFADDVWRDRAAAGRTLLARAGALVVGLATVVPSSEDDHEAELVSVWVDPATRGAGVGAALVRGAVDLARSLGAQRVALWVTTTNEPARALYESAGFVRTGEHKPLPSDSRLEELRMVRALREADDDDEDEVLEPLDTAAARALAERYLQYFLLSTGDRAARLQSASAFEVWEEVYARVAGEADPLPMLDALVALAFDRAPDDEGEFLTHVAAGPVEDAVVERPDLREGVAERCRHTDPAWRETVRGVWADAELAATFPEPLDRLVTCLGDAAVNDGPDGTTRGSARRPSKRQSRAGRGRHR